jgi:hypothetical protein
MVRNNWTNGQIRFVPFVRPPNNLGRVSLENIFYVKFGQLRNIEIDIVNYLQWVKIVFVALSLGRFRKHRDIVSMGPCKDPHII